MKKLRERERSRQTEQRKPRLKTEQYVYSVSQGNQIITPYVCTLSTIYTKATMYMYTTTTLVVHVNEANTSSTFLHDLGGYNAKTNKGVHNYPIYKATNYIQSLVHKP